MMCHIKSLTSKETVWVSNRTRCSNCHSCNGSFVRQASFSPPRSILFFCCYGLNGFAAASSANPSLLVTSMANFPPPQQPPRPTLPSVFHPIFPWTSDREKREERKNNFDQIVHHYHRRAGLLASQSPDRSSGIRKTILFLDVRIVILHS